MAGPGTPLPRSPLAPAAPPRLPAVAGARWATHAAGLRYRGRDDLMLLELAPGTTAGGVFTRSATAGHPVLWNRRTLGQGPARALLVNAGNANVFRGAEGDAAVAAEATGVAELLGCAPEEVFVASTGVIGERLPVEPILAALPALRDGLAAEAGDAAAAAIMTTDTFPKTACARCTVDGRTVTVAGIAKGSGMIAPDMATMLAFLVTDARLPGGLLQRLTRAAADRSFNSITVDGDTSTSDMLLVFATGQAAHEPLRDAEDPRLGPLRDAIEQVCGELAELVARDGEGARKLVAISVAGTADDAAARQIARTIGNSPLIKTAIAGGDANWGRVVMAVGRAGVPFDIARLGIAFGGIALARDGAALAEFDTAAVDRHVAGSEVLIDVTVGDGPGRARVLTCDLTEGYIAINADYRS